MGSDGSIVAHNGSVGGTGKILMPSGQGGGCIMSGPFAVSQWHAVVNRTSVEHIIAGRADEPGTNQSCNGRDGEGE